jgi:hypothetical protein
MTLLAIESSWRPDRPNNSILDDLPRSSPPLVLSPLLWPSTVARLRKKERRSAAVCLLAERPSLWREEMILREALPLITTDREMRSRFLQEALRTPGLAADLEAPVVLAPWTARQKEKAPYAKRLDVARLVLEPLLEECARRGVWLAIPAGGEESPPSLQEIAALCQEFAGAPLGYWHCESREEAEAAVSWALAKDADKAPGTSPTKGETTKQAPSGGILLLDLPPETKLSAMDLNPSPELLRFSLESGMLPGGFGGVPAYDLDAIAKQAQAQPGKAALREAQPGKAAPREAQPREAQPREDMARQEALSGLRLLGVSWPDVTHEEVTNAMREGLRKRFPQQVGEVVIASAYRQGWK